MDHTDVLRDAVMMVHDIVAGRESFERRLSAPALTSNAVGASAPGHI